MKEFKDFTDDEQFPIAQEQTYAPIFRDFGENIITRFGVYIGEFVYPPIVVEDVIGKCKVEQKTNIKPFLLGLTVLLLGIFGFIFLLWWLVLFWKRKRLARLPVYVRQNQTMANQPPTEMPYREQELVFKQAQEKLAPTGPAIAENMDLYANNEPGFHADPIVLIDNVESVIKEACNTENIQSNGFETRIMPCEGGDGNPKIATKPVAATERVTPPERVSPTKCVMPPKRVTPTKCVMPPKRVTPIICVTPPDRVTPTKCVMPPKRVTPTKCVSTPDLVTPTKCVTPTECVVRKRLARQSLARKHVTTNTDALSPKPTVTRKTNIPEPIPRKTNIPEPVPRKTNIPEPVQRKAKVEVCLKIKKPDTKSTARK